jgi:hypothetical protein
MESTQVAVDMDGVMINSRDNAKRMEGKLGMVGARASEGKHIFPYR